MAFMSPALFTRDAATRRPGPGTMSLRQSSRRRALQAALIFIVAALVFLISPVYIISDSHFTLLLSQNILRHGHFRLDEYVTRPFDPRLVRHRSAAKLTQLGTANGHTYYYFPVGSSILSMPFIPFLNALGLSPVRADGGYDWDGELAMQRRVAAVLMAVLASILFLTARLVLPAGWSMLVAVAGAFGTQVWSTASRVLWSHTWGSLLLSIVIFLLVASERRGRRISPFLLASLLSWMYFARPTHVIAVATVSVYMLIFEYDRKAFLRYALTGAAWLALFVAYSYHHFGQVLPPYYLHSGFAFGSSFVLRPYVVKAWIIGSVGNLISPSRGLFVYVPVVLFVAYLLVRYRKSVPSSRLTVLAIGNVVGLYIVVSGFGNWWGGHSYGPRLLTDLVPWFALLGTFGVDAMIHPSEQPTGGRRLVELTVGAVLLVLSVAINARGALSWDTALWNPFPVNVDQRPERLWDWSEPQFLAGAIKPLGSGAEVYDPRRP